jgi:integrase
MPSRHLAEDRNAGDAHDAGLSARQIADHLGHSRPSLTQDVYLGRGTASPQAAAALQGSP